MPSFPPGKKISQQRRQTTADLAVDRLDIRRAVDDPEALRLLRREVQIPVPDPPVKGSLFLLEAVLRRLRPYAGRPLFRPRQTGLHGEIEQ